MFCKALFLSRSCAAERAACMMAPSTPSSISLSHLFWSAQSTFPMFLAFQIPLKNLGHPKSGLPPRPGFPKTQSGSDPGFEESSMSKAYHSTFMQLIFQADLDTGILCPAAAAWTPLFTQSSGMLVTDMTTTQKISCTETE